MRVGRRSSGMLERTQRTTHAQPTTRRTDRWRRLTKRKRNATHKLGVGRRDQCVKQSTGSRE